MMRSITFCLVCLALIQSSCFDQDMQRSESDLKTTLVQIRDLFQDPKEYDGQAIETTGLFFIGDAPPGSLVEVRNAIEILDPRITIWFDDYTEEMIRASGELVRIRGLFTAVENPEGKWVLSIRSMELNVLEK